MSVNLKKIGVENFKSLKNIEMEINDLNILIEKNMDLIYNVLDKKCDSE